MDDHEISAECDAADKLVMERLDRAGTQHGLLGREIDQIICVNDQRAEAQLLAARAKSSGVHLRDAGWTARPHARTGRENLQSVAAELVRGF